MYNIKIWIQGIDQSYGYNAIDKLLGTIKAFNRIDIKLEIC